MIPLRELFTIAEGDLFQDLAQELRKANYEAFFDHRGSFLFSLGSDPIMLLAHIDCVHGHAETVYYDPLHEVYWSPDGLGADDRAGVWAILYLIEKGYRPSILFTDGEESGCWGARAAAKMLKPLIDAADIRALVELDRRGRMEAVYYDCGSDQIREWIGKVGFIEEFGTFTDISIIAPEWDIAAVNLSIGYYREHTLSEYLVKKNLMETLVAVEKLLQSPPPERWPHETTHYLWSGYSWKGRYAGSYWWKKNEDMGGFPDRHLLLPAIHEGNGEPVAICLLCDTPIWDKREIHKYDEYELCEDCFLEITGYDQRKGAAQKK